MAFEGQGNGGGQYRSPGGFDFGIQGWSYGEPVPRSITFFIDNTAVVTDQYGRVIRRAILPDGREIKFADKPPESMQDGVVVARPEFATHAQVIEALVAERIDWQSYEVRQIKKDGTQNVVSGLTLDKAILKQRQFIDGGARSASIERSIVYAGWPQLPYEELKKLTEVPHTPESTLMKIADPVLRRDALRLRRETSQAVKQELEVSTSE